MSISQELTGHEDCVQTVAFDISGQYVVSAGSDCTYRVYGKVSSSSANATSARNTKMTASSFR